MTKPEYAESRRLKAELLREARKLTKKDIRIALRQRTAFHAWAVEAYEQALAEKEVASARR